MNLSLGMKSFTRLLAPRDTANWPVLPSPQSNKMVLLLLLLTLELLKYSSAMLLTFRYLFGTAEPVPPNDNHLSGERDVVDDDDCCC